MIKEILNKCNNDPILTYNYIKIAYSDYIHEIMIDNIILSSCVILFILIVIRHIKLALKALYAVNVTIDKPILSILYCIKLLCWFGICIGIYCLLSSIFTQNMVLFDKIILFNKG